MFDRLHIHMYILLVHDIYILDKTDLAYAAGDGDLIRTKELVSQGEDVNKRSGDYGK